MNVKSKLMRQLPAAAVAVALGAMGGAAIAAQNPSASAQAIDIQPPQNTEATLSQPVSYADLDLATTSGVHTLRSRIDKAATSVCTRLGMRSPSDSFEMQWQDRNICYEGAVSGAMRQADAAIASARERR